MDVVRIMNFGQVIEAAGLLWKGQRVAPAVVRYGYETFLNVNVRRAILAHCAQLH